MATLGVLLFAEVGHWGKEDDLTSMWPVAGRTQTSDKGKKLLKKFPQLA